LADQDEKRTQTSPNMFETSLRSMFRRTIFVPVIALIVLVGDTGCQTSKRQVDADNPYLQRADDNDIHGQVTAFYGRSVP
jgi:hypothetical protein